MKRKELVGGHPAGHYLHCPNGSHMAVCDDQQTYLEGLIDFINNV